MYISKRRMAFLFSLILLVNLSVVIASDQIRLEQTRSALEKELSVALPPGTIQTAAIAYLEGHRRFPEYDPGTQTIEAAEGYDVPAIPARLGVGRVLLIRGYLDDDHRIIRWEATLNRRLLPLP